MHTLATFISTKKSEGNEMEHLVITIEMCIRDSYRSDFKATSQPQVALDVKNLIYGDRLKDISLSLIHI